MSSYISVVRYFIPYVAYKFSSNIVKEDFAFWQKTLRINKGSECKNFVWLFEHLKEFRTVFYWRLGYIGRRLRLLYKDHCCLYIQVDNRKVGGGFVIQHGHASIILIESCGKNCQIWQNVTLGKKQSGDNEGKPKLGDNVKICAGAIVLGNIAIGNNVTIGAGSVVLKDVPENCTVVGNPAKIVRRNGKRVNEIL